MTRSRDLADSQDNLGGAIPPYVGSKNFVINGGMDVWQRGTSIVGSGSVANYTADRWQTNLHTNFTISRQATNDTTNLPDIQYCARVQRTNGNTTANQVQFAQTLETNNSIPFAGKTVTLSFYARVGANFSGGTLKTTFVTGTGTDQNYASFTSPSYTFTSYNTTTTWQKFSVTISVSSSAKQIALYFYYDATGTAGAADFFEVTGVQLELGSVATPFSRAGGDIQGELAKCQRYYWRQTANASSTFANFRASGVCSSTTGGRMMVSNPVEMRVVPTSVDYANCAVWEGSNWIALTVITIDQSSIGSTGLSIGTAGSLTTNRPIMLTANNNANAYFGLSAEL